MAIGAGKVIVSARVFEGLAARGHLLHLLTAALGQNGVAGVAVIGFDGFFAILGLVVAVVTAGTAGPDHVADVVRIDTPVGLHFGKEIVAVNLLHHRDDVTNARFIGITFGQRGGDAIARLVVGLVFAGKDINRVGLDPGQRPINLAEFHGEIDGLVRRHITVGRAGVAIHAVHGA